MEGNFLRLSLTSIVLFLLVHQAVAQPAAPKREFRAVWVATVRHLDYPERPTTDAETLRRQYRELISRYREMGLNAVVFQIRSAADAFYPSELAPWSADLTGRQGLAPSGDFDPLAFFVEETHRQGMEFHAWFNPYRATLDLDTLSLAPGHVFNRHRDWLLRYGDRFYLNPARHEVRTHLLEIVTEVIRRYDIDAVHFDDYFYPYKIGGAIFPDSLDFRRYGIGYIDIEDWRRGNTDQLIEGIARSIKILRPHVRFGISPFGVWRNGDRDPEGSPTRAGATTYDDLYADVRKWMRRGWIDYVAPQLYWSIGFAPADHRALLDWWSRNRNGCQLYIGYAAYKVGNNTDSAWHVPAELPRQIDLGRRGAAAQGGIFFRSAFLLDNPLGVTDSLRRRYAAPALIPEYPGPALDLPRPPERLRHKRRRGAVELRWHPAPAPYDRPPGYYVVYRFVAGSGIAFDDPANIIGVTPIGVQQEQFEFTDTTAQRGRRYLYTVTAVNRYHKESAPAEGRRVKGR